MSALQRISSVMRWALIVLVVGVVVTSAWTIAEQGVAGWLTGMLRNIPFIALGGVVGYFIGRRRSGRHA